MKKFNYKSRKGFTLIELLVVIGILAVLAAIAIPSVAGLIDRANVSSDDTNANEMTNAIERFVSEYELYCQDIASNRIDFDDLDSAQSRVYNVTAIEKREHITQIENGGYINRKLDKDTKYPDDYGTTVAIIQNYTKTSSSTFEPKQSDMHFWYSPDCGVVVYSEPESATSVLNTKIISGKDAKGKELTDSTRWIDITTGKESEYVANYNSEQIANNPLLFPIGKTKPEYVLAEFNENFTEVTIYKNGKNSNGKMKDLSGNGSISNMTPDTSPMTAHAETLKRVKICEGVVSIGKSAFENCTNITNVALPNSLTDIGSWAFAKCSNLQGVNIPNNVLTLGNSINGYVFEDCTNLQNVTLGNNIVTIGSYSFKNCSSLKDVTIPVTAKTIGSYAFYNCTNLENMYYEGNIDEWAKINFASMYSNPMIYAKNEYINNELVKDVTLSNDITEITYAFVGSDTLETIVVPDTVTKIGFSAFRDCFNLQSITLSQNITAINGYTFSGCRSLKNIVIPEGVTSIGAHAFASCTSLKDITIPATLSSVDSWAFYCCNINNLYFTGTIEDWLKIDFYHHISNPMSYSENEYINGELLTSIVIPEGITNVKKYAFCSCEKVTNISLPSTLNTIETYAFFESAILPSITIPSSVTSIENDAFEYCYKLKTVYGQAGSYAETWALKEKLTFVAQ